MSDALPHEAYRSARAFVEHCDLTPKAVALLDGDRQSLTDYFKLLLQKRLYPDAIRFSAHALPKRQAVWWGCLGVWLADRPDPDPAESAALRAALAWVQDQTDEARRAAGEAARAAGADTPAGGVAMAAFLSGGSLAPPGGEPVPPEPDLTGRMVAAALLTASRRAGAGPEATARQQQFLKLGNEVANGRNGWEARPDRGERARRPGGA